MQIEHTVGRELLGEHPRRTALDALVEDSRTVICIEAKLGEQGFGTCSCAEGSGDPLRGRCSKRVIERERYWDAARDVYGLPDRSPPSPCPISAGYQAIRNAAAACAFAGDTRLAVFLLLYDEHNPYFRPTGRWPGWPALLEA